MSPERLLQSETTAIEKTKDALRRALVAPTLQVPSRGLLCSGGQFCLVGQVLYDAGISEYDLRLWPTFNATSITGRRAIELGFDLRTLQEAMHWYDRIDTVIPGPVARHRLEEIVGERAA